MAKYENLKNKLNQRNQGIVGNTAPVSPVIRSSAISELQEYSKRKQNRDQQNAITAVYTQSNNYFEDRLKDLTTPVYTSPLDLKPGAKLNFKPVWFEGSALPKTPDATVVSKEEYEVISQIRDEINNEYKLKSDVSSAKRDFENAEGFNPVTAVLEGIVGHKSDKQIAKENYQTAVEKYYQNKYGVEDNLSTIYNSLTRLSKKEKTEDVENDIKNIGEVLHGKVLLDDWIKGNIAGGLAQYSSQVYSSLDATLGKALKLAGWENNPISRVSDSQKQYYESLNQISETVASASGDKNNISGKITQGVIAFIPDMLLMFLTKNPNASTTLKTASNLGKSTAKITKLSPLASISSTGKGITSAASESLKTVAKNPMYWTSFARTFGSDYERAVEKGVDDPTAYIYALVTSTANALIELGGVQSLPTKLQNKTSRQILSWIRSAVEEGGEEVVQGVISELNEKLMYQQNKKWGEVFDPKRMGEEFLVGTAVGGIIGGAQLAGQTISTAKYVEIGKTVRNTVDVKGIIAYAQKSSNENIRNIAVQNSDGKISNKDLGTLYAYTVNDIATAFNAANNINELNQVVDEIAAEGNPEIVNNIAFANYVRRVDEISSGPENISGAESAKEKLDIEKAPTQETAEVDIDSETAPTNQPITNMNPISKKGRDYVIKIANRLGVDAEFVDIKTELQNRGEDLSGLAIYPEGFYDKAKHKLYIGNDTVNPVQFVFKHELTHYCEQSNKYNDFVTAIRGTKAYKKWLQAQSSVGNVESDFKESELIKAYRSRYADIQSLDVEAAQAEVVANFVGDTLFKGDVESLERLLSEVDSKQRNVVVQFIYDFFQSSKSKFAKNSAVTMEILRLERMYADVLKDARQYKPSGETDNGIVFSENEQQKTTTEEGSGVKYSIAYTINNKPVLVVNDDILKNATNNKEKVAIVKQSLGRFKKVPIKGQTIHFITDTKQEYTSSKYSRWLSKNDQTIFDDKMRVAAHPQDIVYATTDYINESLNHSRKDNIVDFARGTLLIDVAGRQYESEVVIGFTKSGICELHDIVNLTPTKFEYKKETVSKGIDSNESTRSDTTSKHSIPNSSETVNKKFSLPENRPTTDSTGAELSEGQQRFFKNSKLRDSSGRLLKLYHGTKKGGFTKFLSKYSDDGISLFLAKDQELAETYSGSAEKIQLPEGKTGLARLFEKGTDKSKGQVGIYEVYANAQNPYVLECDGANWNSLPFNEDMEGKTRVSFECDFDTQSKTLKTKVVIDGKVHEKTFNFKHFDKQIDEIMAEDRARNIEPDYNWELSILAKKEIADYYNSFANENIVKTILPKTIGSIAVESNENLSLILDNKTGKNTELNTRYVSNWAKNNGYDAVVFENIRDTGGFAAEGVDLVGDVVIVYDGSQIKSVDNLNPTKNKDIRYSLPENASIAEIGDAYKNGEITQEEFESAINAASKEKVLNPAEIASLPKEAANTTPKLKEPKRTGSGDGDSRLYPSLLNSDIVTDEVKKEIQKDTFIKNYGTTTNKQTLEIAAGELAEGGAERVYKFENLKDHPERASAVDVAVGLILLERYQRAGDTSGALKIAETLRSIGTVSGQTVQIFSILGRFTPENMIAYAQQELSKAYEELVKAKSQKWVDKYAKQFELTEKEKEFIRHRISLASKLEDGDRNKAIYIAEVCSLIQNKIPPEPGDTIRALQRISLLLNPKTNVRNILGNASMVGTYIASDFFGNLIDKQISKKTNIRTTGSFKFKGSGAAFAKGLYETYDDFKRGIHTKMEEINRFENSMRSGKNFNEHHTGILAKQLNDVAKFCNGLDNFTSAVLEAGDRPFFEMWFNNSLNNQMRLNNVDVPTKEMLEIAREEAMTRTWQDNNIVTRGLQNVKKSLNIVRIPGTSYGLGDFVLKFVKTPANIGKAMVEFSPVGLGIAAAKASTFKNALETGRFTPEMQKELVRSTSNAIVGTLTYIMVAVAASLGWIKLSGKGDDDKEAAAFEKYIVGIPPYSMEMFGEHVTYDWNQPMGAVLATVADFMESKDDSVERPWHEDLLDALKTGGAVFMEQSFLKGLYEFFSADDPITGLYSMALSEPAAFMPQFFSQIASLTDPYRRTTYDAQDSLKTAVNQVINKVPGLRKSLPEQINVLGEKAENVQYMNPWQTFISPANKYPKSSGETAEAIYGLYKKSGNKAVFPKVAPNSITVLGETKTFTPQEKAQLQTQMGQTSVEILEKMFASEAFEKLNDEQKVYTVSKVYDYAFRKAKSSLEYSYETVAKMEGGEDVLTRDKYNRLSKEAIQLLLDDYFLTNEMIKCKGNADKLAKLFVDKTIKEAKGK